MNDEIGGGLIIAMVSIASIFLYRAAMTRSEGALRIAWRIAMGGFWIVILGCVLAAFGLLGLGKIVVLIGMLAGFCGIIVGIFIKNK